jgi:RHS repeat-associated protein
VVAPQNAVDIYYIHADHLGTPRVITRPSDDKVLWQWDNTEAFGNNAPNENPNGVGAFSFNLRFPGQYYDQETGTHYNYFRDYDPATGRYRQSDPIGLKGGVNTFGYVGGNPLKYTDPTGEWFFIPLFCAGGGGAAAGAGAAAAAGTGGLGLLGTGLAALGLATLMTSDSNDADAKQRQAEYERYKTVCNQSPPPGLSPCDEARWKMNRNKQCKQLRQDWDNKWSPGRHAGDIANLGRAIAKLEEFLAKNCGGGCNDCPR